MNGKTFVKSNYGKCKFDLFRTFLVNKHCYAVKDASDARGFKIRTKMVPELDGSSKN